ncbi:l-serine dehydratase [Moniliophthora roreri]|nr:l-serine dehydratase [Moniliophthora roreri]
MRAGRIFTTDLDQLNLLHKVKSLKITLYGSLAATGKGLGFRHHTPQAILLGLEGSDPETIVPTTIDSRYENILSSKILHLGGRHRINYDMDRDMLWRWDQVLKTHPNGMRFSAFDEEGDLLATNEYFSVGGGFVVNEKTKVDENLFYKGVDKNVVHGARLHQSHSLSDPTTLSDASLQHDSNPTTNSAPQDEIQPPYPFESGSSLLALTKKHNMTIAQIVYDNEKSFGYTDDDIHNKIFHIWSVMDECIHTGVSSTATTLPGRLGLRRRAPALYRRLMKGFYPEIAAPLSQARIEGGQMLDAINKPLLSDYEEQSDNFESQPRSLSHKTSKATRVVGSFDHPLLPHPPCNTNIPAMDFLSCYAIAVNEVNASGGRIVTSPTNGAAGVIPAVLKYIVEFVSDDPDKSVMTFLLTASVCFYSDVDHLSDLSSRQLVCFSREEAQYLQLKVAVRQRLLPEKVGVACSMASAGFAACMGASPETVLQAAEIGIEHNLGLTCDPIDGLVQVPCIERNSLGAVKAITAAQLSLASQGVYSVTLDEAIEAMRVTAADMSVKYKETSLSGLATTVKIPLTVPACISVDAPRIILNRVDLYIIQYRIPEK